MKNITLYSIFAITLIATGCTQAGTTNTNAITTNANSNKSNTNVVVNSNTANVNVVNENTANTNTSNENANTNEAVATTVEQTEGVTWLAEPEKTTDRGLFNSEPEAYTYYKIADLSDGGELFYVTYSTMGTLVFRFRMDAAGKYYLLTKHSDTMYSDYQNEVLNTDLVTVDDTTTYNELTFPETLEVADMTLDIAHIPFSYNQFLKPFQEATPGTLSLVGSTEYGDVYELQRSVDTTVDNGSIEVKQYVLKLADTSTIKYLAKKDFLVDDNTLVATLNDSGSAFASRVLFRGLIADGCGVSGGEQYVTNVTEDQLTSIGTTPSGEPLYSLTDSDSSVLKNAYEMYKFGRDYEGSTIELLSYEDFVAKQPVMLWQDDAGDYLVYADSELAPLVECGKPVIYLYPTKPTNVSVKVGAQVTVSEPTYGSGWNVLAQPSGQLTTNAGESAENLYWEGKGYGEYPKITTGKVVPRYMVVNVIRNDLTTLGLNQSEIQDFLEFWQDRLPTTPYVRLSWLTTEQMNSLAPLRVSPQPDSVLRVFLDFSGQTSPFTNLQPQVLSKTDRSGFILVEWGGLLVGQK